MIEKGDLVIDNLSAECREVIKITRKGVHLTDSDNTIFISFSALQEGISNYRYGIIPNE